MSSLRSRSAPVSRAATALEFHEDEYVWVSTPVRASQRSESVDKFDYAFSYGDEELVKQLRSHGFKPNVGLTFDGLNLTLSDVHRFWVRLRAIFIDESIEAPPRS
ncbi:hypothetical protein CYMTET_51125 [Cymbomonas tetramitiformis]|uniref:Uncharacterized protein n=1 Tax=Cymbomonas tetramitiformis TaxID=36881 RepID=A0AAE0BNN7_9CHLO|nr:hypothetical protein CYMTET_51125 [Cymbomonas tetramitiformis]